MDRELIKYVETSCSNCVLRVIATADADDRWPFVELQLLSAHADVDANSPRGRLQRAWRGLRGAPTPWLEILSRDELDRIVTALSEAGTAAFG